MAAHGWYISVERRLSIPAQSDTHEHERGGSSWGGGLHLGVQLFMECQIYRLHRHILSKVDGHVFVHLKQ